MAPKSRDPQLHDGPGAVERGADGGSETEEKGRMNPAPADVVGNRPPTGPPTTK